MKDKKYVVIDNIFNDVESLMLWGMTNKFYTKKTHPHKKYFGNLNVKKTKYLNNLDEKKYNYVLGQIIRSCSILLEKHYSEYYCEICFESSLKKDFNKIKFNKDKINNTKEFNHQLNGVIFLNKDADKKAGILMKENNVLIENIYNRCFIYDSNLETAIADSFGKSLKDSRLTLSFKILLK